MFADYYEIQYLITTGGCYNTIKLRSKVELQVDFWIYTSMLFSQVVPKNMCCGMCGSIGNPRGLPNWQGAGPP